MIERSGAFRVVAEAGSGREAVDLTLALSPDLLLLDLRFGDRDGIHALQAVREARSGTRVAIVTASQDPTHLQSALRAGPTAI